MVQGVGSRVTIVGFDANGVPHNVLVDASGSILLGAFGPIGAETDLAAVGDGSLIAIMKYIRSQLALGLVASGTAVTLTHSAAAIGIASTAVIAAEATRKSLLIINDSDKVIYLNAMGAPAVLNTGIRLNAAGGSFEMNLSAGNLSTAAINGIAATAGGILLVTQGV